MRVRAGRARRYVPLISNVLCFQGNATLPVTLIFAVTSLLPGTSYNFDLMFSSPDGTTLTLYALGDTGTTPGATSGAPVIMTTQAV